MAAKHFIVPPLGSIATSDPVALWLFLKSLTWPVKNLLKLFQTRKGVWNHFGFLKENDGPVDKTRVACKLCPVKTILKYSGNTTNLTDHLRRKHSKFLKEQSESRSSDAKAATVKQTTHSSKQVLSTLFSAKLSHSSSRAKAIWGIYIKHIFLSQ